MDESGIDWDAVKRQEGGRNRVYQSRLCPFCNQVISEGAWGSRDSNWKKHCKACEKKRAERGGQA